MNPTPVKILSTRPVGIELKQQAAAVGIDILEISFITINRVEGDEVINEINATSNKNSVVIFTSMNAVEAVAKTLETHKPTWKIGCIGQTTLQLVRQYFPGCHVIATGNNAEDLANSVVELHVGEEVVFFCGSERRDELPSILKRNGINVHEVVVYQTEETDHRLSENFDGILFYSPSAVRSFFKSNTVGNATVFFAVGKTTAAEIALHSRNKTIISETPGKVQLVQKMIAFYTSDLG